MLESLGAILLVLGAALVLVAAYKIVMWVVRNQFTCKSCGTYLNTYEVAFCITCDKEQRMLEWRYEQHAEDEAQEAYELWAYQQKNADDEERGW